MTEESVAEWDWLCDHLEEMGLLSGSDVALMAIYCDAWAQYREICEELKESGMIAMGKTGYYIAAQMNVQAMLRKQIRDVAGELGLSAVARARLHVGKTRKESDDDEKLLKVVVG